MPRLYYDRKNQRIKFRDENSVTYYPCHDDFFPGYNEEGQPRASLPEGEYTAVAETPPAENSPEYGTFYISTGDPRGRDIHGGGSNLDDPFAPEQGWLGTYGCLRMQNKDGEDLSYKMIAEGNFIPLFVGNCYAELAKISAEISGMPANWILAQWKHESDNFSNWGTTEANNFAGLKKFRDSQPNWFVGDAQSPEGDDYQVFEDPEDFATYFGRYLRMYESDGLLVATTLREYAEALFRGGYFGLMPGMTADESVDNYVRGLEKWLNG